MTRLSGSPYSLSMLRQFERALALFGNLDVVLDARRARLNDELTCTEVGFRPAGLEIGVLTRYEVVIRHIDFIRTRQKALGVCERLSRVVATGRAFCNSGANEPFDFDGFEEDAACLRCIAADKSDRTIHWDCLRTGFGTADDEQEPDECGADRERFA